MRLYRALLRLYPGSLRAAYGAEMCELHRQRRREVAGPLAVAAFWLQTIGDLLASAVLAHLDLLRQDLRFSVRTLRRSPGFAALAVLMAGLGVGATTATFSTLDHVMVRPLPFSQPDRLVKLWQDQTARGYSRMEVSPANYRDWKQQASSFESMAAYRGLSINLVGEGPPRRLDGAVVEASLLPMLGRAPLLGRWFSPADDREGAPGTVLLSHRLWKSQFAGDPGIVGRTVRLDEASHQVIGVMPPDFNFPRREAEVWRPMRFAAREFEDRADCYLQVLARLRPGVALAQARAEMGGIAARLQRAHPAENHDTGINVISLRDEVARRFRVGLLALAGAALGLLLITCTNLANLLVARALVRRRELAVRTALGAGRERLVRQLLTESLLLGLGGGLLGVLLAVAATPLLARMIPGALPIAATPALDLRVLAFALLLTALTTVGFGALPALRATRAVDGGALREGRTGVEARRERLRSVLVTVQVTVSVVLLISTGLLVRALWQIQAVDPGFRPEGVLTLQTALTAPKYEQVAPREQFYRQVLSHVRALPGVSEAAYTSFLPIVVQGGIWPVILTGQPGGPRAPTASLRFVTPRYFATMGIPLRRGRDLRDGDTRETAFVAVVSESFVRRHFPDGDPLGRRFQIGFAERTVVGVVGDVRVRGLERSTSEPQVYLPPSQVPDGGLVWYAPKDLAIRASLPPASLLPAVRRIIAAADPEQPISDVQTLAAIVADDTAPRAAQVRLISAFCAIAVLLAAIGLHGLLAFAVSSRRQEIGVRMALGADPRQVLTSVLGRGLLLAGLGVLLGLLLASAVARSLQALLAGVSPWDARTFAAAALVALLMTAAGSLLPAWRAIRVDPLTALRAE
jgi:predicted permease